MEDLNYTNSQLNLTDLYLYRYMSLPLPPAEPPSFQGIQNVYYDNPYSGPGREP